MEDWQQIFQNKRASELTGALYNYFRF